MRGRGGGGGRLSSGCTRGRRGKGEGGGGNTVKLRSPTLIVTFHPSIHLSIYPKYTFSADWFDANFEIGKRSCRVSSCPIKVAASRVSRFSRRTRLDRRVEIFFFFFSNISHTSSKLTVLETAIKRLKEIAVHESILINRNQDD